MLRIAYQPALYALSILLSGLLPVQCSLKHKYEATYPQ